MAKKVEKIYMIIYLIDNIMYQGETISLVNEERAGVFPVYKTREIAEKYAEEKGLILEFEKVTNIEKVL